MYFSGTINIRNPLMSPQKDRWKPASHIGNTTITDMSGSLFCLMTIHLYQ